jgi:peptidoglycan/xylan/chitin deacetylase (PgdA/CDA1 family)
MHSDVHPLMFTRCLDLVRETGLPAWTLRQCAQPAVHPATDVICFTFDDGWETDVLVALPELRRRGFGGTFFVTTGNIGTPRFLSWTQVRALASAGMEIGSHTCSHADLTRLRGDALERELSASRRELEDRLGQQVDSVSIPHDAYNRRVLETAGRVGYAYICVSRPGLNPLPLTHGRPVRRNALHRAVAGGGLARFIRPDRAALLRRDAGYVARAVIKRVLSEERYANLRRVVTGHGSMGR